MNMFLMSLICILASNTTIMHKNFTDRQKDFECSDCMDGRPHLTLPNLLGDAVLIDSSGNAYTAWTQMQECLAYNPAMGAMLFVCRGYVPTAILNTHQTDSIFSFWISDIVYNQEYGAARYPGAVAADVPYLFFPVLIGGSWGIMVGMYEQGGWFSGSWSTPEDLGPGNVDVHKVFGRQLSNGNILVIGYTDTDAILYRTYSADLQTLFASGTVFSGYYLWGFDYNKGVGYIFYYDDCLNIYYRRINGSGFFSPESIYNMIWPEPYTKNLLFLTQMAVTDSGRPILVFDNLNGDDFSNYPCSSKVYVSIASGQPCIEVSNSPYCFYPTIATNGNYAIVLYHSARQNSGRDSLAWFDLKAAVSYTNGNTWSNVINITSELTNRPGLAQLSKRFAADLGRFYYFYGINMINNHDPIWHAWRDPEGIDPHAWYVGWHDTRTGIEEEPKQTAKSQNTRLSVYPNPFFEKTNIRYMMQDSRCTILKIFDASGRLVKSFDLESCIMDHESIITWNGTDDLGHILPPGVYFIELTNGITETNTKVIKCK